MVAHLCARLLESSAEIRSTILVQRVYRSFLQRTGRGDLVERARAAKARARAKAAADRAAAAAACGGDGAVPFTPPTRRSGPGAAAAAAAAGAACARLEQTMYVSEKQRAHLAAVTIQRWWVAGAGERLRRLVQSTAATAVQAAWRGRAAREAVRAERAAHAEEAERRIQEVNNGRVLGAGQSLHVVRWYSAEHAAAEVRRALAVVYPVDPPQLVLLDQHVLPSPYS